VNVNDIKKQATDKMAKSVESLRVNLTHVRTGRAHVGLLDAIRVDYYGSEMPINQVANVTLADARTISIQPYEKKMVQVVEKAIRDSDLGVNPGTDGIVIRVVFPQLTEQRRRELGKTARSKGEDAKVSIRNIRRKAKETLDKMSKDGDAGEDDVARAEKELQSITDRYVAQVDELVKHKEAELLEV